MEKEILACRSLSIGYDGAALCSGIDFTLGEGEYMCVVGHSGMGKTCFALTLMGLVKPVAGEVEYLNSLKREEIGYVPQSDEIHGPLSVRDVVLSGLSLIHNEPMHGLDAVAKDEMFDEIDKIHRIEKTAVILIDHEALDGTVLHLSDTQLYCGNVEDYIKSVPGQFYFAGRII